MEFNELGFRFQYPDNWTVMRDASRTFPRSVQVQSPSGAFWSVTADRQSTSAMVDHLTKILQREYEEAECTPLERTIGEHHLVGSELYFYCLDFVVTAQILVFERNGTSWAILTQGELRDFESLQAVFDAMTWSLLHADATAHPRA